MGIRDELIEIERRLWKNDPVLYRENFTAEALVTFPETGVIDIDFAVEAIRKENAEGRRWAEARFEDVRTMHLSADVAVLLYKGLAGGRSSLGDVDPVTARAPRSRAAERRRALRRS
jgi:hypothetical protein